MLVLPVAVQIVHTLGVVAGAKSLFSYYFCGIFWPSALDAHFASEMLLKRLTVVREVQQAVSAQCMDALFCAHISA
jgi:hypothetical protein